jgi:hypothetical protein
MSIPAALVKYSIALEKSLNPGTELSEIRKAVLPEDYKLLVKSIKRFRQVKIRSLNNSSVSGYNSLGRAFVPVFIDVEKEIKWARATLLNNIDSINKYLIESKKFSNALLSGEFKKASITLDNIEKELGTSLWLIKTRIAFLQISQGLESQKKFVQQVKESASFKGTLAFIAHWVSIRNEGTVSPQRFTSQFESLLAKMGDGVSAGFESYFRYHILSDEDLMPLDAIHLLRREIPNSVIDYYEAFLVASRSIAARGSKEFIKNIVTTVENISLFVNDGRVQTIKAALGIKTALPASPQEVSEAHKLFLAGSYSDALVKANLALAMYPDDPLLLAIAAIIKSFFNNEENSDSELINSDESGKIAHPINTLIINKLATVLKRGTAAVQEFNELTKIGINFSAFSWAAPIKFLLISEKDHSPKADVPSVVNVLKIPYAHTFMLELMDGIGIEDEYLNSCKELSLGSSNLTYALARLKKSSIPKFANGISAEALALIKCEQYYESGEFTEVLADAKILINASGLYYQRKGHRFLSHSLFFSNLIENACEYVAAIYVREPHLYPALPISNIVRIVDPQNGYWDNLSPTLALSIVLDAYKKHIAKDKESQLSWACEDFLLKNGMTRPTELVPVVQQYDISQVIYYLREVCIESVLDTSAVFTGSDDIATERLNICRALSEIDIENLDGYKQEIKNLVRRQVIGSRVQEVEQSKIYADVSKVRAWATLELQESFSRYIAYLKHGLDPQTTASREKAKVLMTELEIDKLIAMTVPDNEVNALFRHIVLELRDAYASSYEMGLERYISTRIRHGALENQLRRPLDTYSLITKRDGKQGPYKSNQVWIDKLNLSNEIAISVDKMFSEFSLKYDALISRMNNDWLQVKRTFEETGYFNFMIVDGEVAFLASQVTAETTFRELLDLIIGYLEEKLTASLDMIRKSVGNEAKKEARDLMTTLQVKLASTLEPAQLHDIDMGINVTRTLIQNIFDKVVEWFSPSESAGSSIYELEDAVNVAEEIMKGSSPDFSVQFSLKDESDKIFLQGALPKFVDILTNAFENVISYSNIVPPVAHVSAAFESHGSNYNLVIIKIVNDLGPEVNMEYTQSKASEINGIIKTGKYEKSLASEGGTGSFKIHRSLLDLQGGKAIDDTLMGISVIDNQYVLTLRLSMYSKEELAEAED